jgi:hypothetical protein
MPQNGGRTLIQWVGLEPPKEMQAKNEQARLEQITGLMQQIVDDIGNHFDGLGDWKTQIVRDGSQVSFSCQCPSAHDPLTVKGALLAMWNSYCNQASRNLREQEWSVWVKFAETVASLTSLGQARESIRMVWNGNDARIELIIEALSQMPRNDGKRGARRLHLECPEDRRARFESLVRTIFERDADEILKEL